MREDERMREGRGGARPAPSASDLAASQPPNLSTSQSPNFSPSHLLNLSPSPARGGLRFSVRGCMMRLSG